jgi:predicted phage-related endonuclease
MAIRYFNDLIQGTDEWLAARCGMLTASEMKLILTPTLKVAANDKSRAHTWELLAQRITGHVEAHYVGDDMLRGQEDEVEARILYAERYAPVETMGFITNDRWGFTIGYSPDGLVGTEGLIECKSRRQKYQVPTIVENVAGEGIPDDYVLQVQTGLLVSERKWCDLVSYSGGLPMATMRVEADPEMQAAIVAAAAAFEADLAKKMATYRAVTASKARLIPTERKIEQEMFV